LGAGCEVAHVAPLLRLGAVGQDRHDAHRVVAADDGGERAVAGCDLGERQRIGDMIGPCATPFGRHRHAHEAQRTQLAEEPSRSHWPEFGASRSWANLRAVSWISSCSSVRIMQYLSVGVRPSGSDTMELGSSIVGAMVSEPEGLTPNFARCGEACDALEWTLG